MPRVTKEQAAEILNMTTRAVERYTKQNRLSATYEKGRTRPVPMYDEAEVKELAAALLQPSFTGAIATQRDNSDPDVAIQPSQALQAPLQQEMAANLAALLDRLVTAQEAQGNSKQATLSLADKLTLSLAEAAQLSGLSRGYLRAAIGEGTLKARIIGRGWRVKRDDLDGYVKKL